MISSEIGSVASMRAPRITRPASVSSLMRAAMKGSACCAELTARFVCGGTSVCVRHKSFSRMYSW